MRKMVLVVVVALAVGAGVFWYLNRGPEDKSRRPSPPASAACRFTDGRSVTVDYSSPRVKGRAIFGGLVPYGKVWRAGANEATTFVSDTDLVVGGQPVPRGAYTIFVLPEADRWQLIVSRKTGEWGIPYPGEKDDLTRAPMIVSASSAPVENFTIAFEQSGTRCTMTMDWASTRGAIEIAEAGAADAPAPARP